MQKFKTTIGLEIHIELKTKTKMFCDCPVHSNKMDSVFYWKNNKKTSESYNQVPNQYVCPVCLGYPGVLPVPNKKAILYALKLGLALGCEIPEESKFDRKHYFYPDLPKNYQISQYDKPFARGGVLNIKTQNSNFKKIRITRVHLEEDAGKLIHPKGADYSLVDYNRGGVPLIETVTDPDIESPSEAKQFLKDLRLIVRYLDISDANMEKGHLRCDANISVQFGKETTPIFEIKNLNSFRSVERALAYEEKRLRDDFETLKKEKGKRTLTWLETENKTKQMRQKEEAADYRYFPEPDIPVFYPHKLFDLKKIKKDLPEMPKDRMKELKEKYNLADNEAEVFLQKPKWYDYFVKVAEPKNALLVADLIINENLGISIDKKVFAEIISGLEQKKITRTFLKQTILPGILEGKKLEELLQQVKVFDLETVVKKVLSQNQAAVDNFRKGKENALQFLLGQVMKETRGQAQPSQTIEMIKKMIK